MAQQLNNNAVLSSKDFLDTLNCMAADEEQSVTQHGQNFLCSRTIAIGCKERWKEFLLVFYLFM